MADGQTTPVTAPPPGGKCGTCGKEREVKMDKPGTVGKAPAKGTKFRSAAVTQGRGRPRINKRDYRYVEFH